MPRTIPIALATALLCLAPARGDETIDDLRKLDGTWSMIEMEENGKQATADQFRSMTVIFDEGRYEVKAGSMIVESGSYKLDATTSPKTIDFKILKGDGMGKTQLGVYLFDRDTVKLCVSVPPGSTSRPKSMTTQADSQTLLMVMKKKAP